MEPNKSRNSTVVPSPGSGTFAANANANNSNDATSTVPTNPEQKDHPQPPSFNLKSEDGEIQEPVGENKNDHDVSPGNLINVGRDFVWTVQQQLFGIAIDPCNRVNSNILSILDENGRFRGPVSIIRCLEIQDQAACVTRTLLHMSETIRTILGRPIDPIMGLYEMIDIAEKEEDITANAIVFMRRMATLLCNHDPERQNSNILSNGGIDRKTFLGDYHSVLCVLQRFHELALTNSQLEKLAQQRDLLEREESGLETEISCNNDEIERLEKEVAGQGRTIGCRKRGIDRLLDDRKRRSQNTEQSQRKRRKGSA